MTLQDAHADLRRHIRKLCAHFPNTDWQQLAAENAYPETFVQAMTGAGYLAALIPEEYGGGGSMLTEASVILEEINRSGGNAAVCHAQMYIMGTLLRYGSPVQKAQYLPPSLIQICFCCWRAPRRWNRLKSAPTASRFSSSICAPQLAIA